MRFIKYMYYSYRNISKVLEKDADCLSVNLFVMMNISTEAPKMRSWVVWWRWMFIEARTHNAHCKAGHNG